jgi:EmrB/QacA subfamily drug resistance transporter
MEDVTRKYLVFGSVALALLMSSIDFSILAVGLPAMQAGLHTSLLLIGWTITIYEFGQLLVFPLAGKLADELGRKPVVLAAVAIFTVSSFLCGLAPNVYVLILCRFVQALGGGAIVPSCTGIVAELFADKRAQAVGLFSSIFPIGGVIGPNIGGLIVDHLSWRFIFYVNVPLGIAVLALTWWLYQPARHMAIRHRPDWAGTALYGSAILIFLIVLSWLGVQPQSAPRSPLLWFVVACALASLAVFAWHERRTPEPLLDMALLKGKAFIAANAYAFIWGAGIYGFIAFLPTYAELHYHMSATEAGALLTPRGIIMILVSIAASFYLIRSGYRKPMIAGVLIVSASLLLTSLGPDKPYFFGMHVDSFIYLASVIGFLGVGFGLSGPASNNAALDLAPDKIAGITGIRSMFRETGGTLGAGTTVFVVTLFASPARGLQVMFVVLAIVLLLIVPVVFLIPDSARESRRRPQATEPAAEPVGAGSDGG